MYTVWRRNLFVAPVRKTPATIPTSDSKSTAGGLRFESVVCPAERMIVVPTPRGIDPADMRRAGAALHDHVESAAAAFAEHRAAMAEASRGWVGKSGEALQEMLVRLAEQDRELLASGRDIAHHMMSAGSDETSVDGQPADSR